MTEYQRLRPSFILLHVSLGALLGVGGATTAWAAYRAAGPHAAHLVALGGVEAVSALLFLVPRTLRLGAVGLVLCCAVADATANINARTRMPFRKPSPPDTWLPFDDAQGRPTYHNPNGRIPGGRAPAPRESL